MRRQFKKIGNKQYVEILMREITKFKGNYIFRCIYFIAMNWDLHQHVYLTFVLFLLIKAGFKFASSWRGYCPIK